MKQITRLPLFALAWPWEIIQKYRRFAYKYGVLHQESFRVPIISVGNLTFGGTGKTPFTIWLANHFSKQQKRVMVLMRGYKGKLEHGRGILHTNLKVGHNPFDYGDEALVLAKRLDNAAVVVGKNRAENLKHYFHSEQPDVVILDDGHQHLRLHRVLNVVLFDLLMPLRQYCVAPMGYMREGFSSLKDADIVVLGRADQVPAERIAELQHKMAPYLRRDAVVAHIAYRPTNLVNGQGESLPVEQLRGKKVIAMAGIGSPRSFFDLLSSLGAEVIERKAFPDHHYFSMEEMTVALERAKKQGAQIITTEKDMVKMRRIVDNPEIYYLRIDVVFLKGETEVINKIANAVG